MLYKIFMCEIQKVVDLLNNGSPYDVSQTNQNSTKMRVSPQQIQAET